MAVAEAVVGIDVGGASKGFHAVGLQHGTATTFRSSSAEDMARWCRELGAHAVAVDAPCAWSIEGRSRPCERRLMARKIWCFSTPTRAAAIANTKQFYRWMLKGEELFKALRSDWKIVHQADAGDRVVLETFPHAVVCALAGRAVPAKPKGRIRRRALIDAGIDVRALTNIDFVDAGLCALTAELHLRGETLWLGDAQCGYIVIPKAAFLQD